MSVTPDDDWILRVTDPLTEGQRVRDMQWLLKGNNRFGHTTYLGLIDGLFGQITAEAAKDMKWFLGYPQEKVTATAGELLRSYLIPKSAPASRLLPSDYIARKNSRVTPVRYPLGKVGEIIGRPYGGTHTRGNWQSDRACDIYIPEGTPILACFAATIGDRFGPLDSDEPALAGLRINLEGEDDDAYYAHLKSFTSGIKPGVKVIPGQSLGLSGKANGVPHLHFALRVGWPPTFLEQTARV